MKQIGLFDESNRLEKLSALGDPLEKQIASLIGVCLKVL